MLRISRPVTGAKEFFLYIYNKPNKKCAAPSVTSPRIALTLLTVSAIPFTDFPQAEISNGLVKARIYLPDAEHGYYRSTRFDWAGVIPDMQYKGHTYFGQWFGRYDPTTNDAIMGPVESFTPLGYEGAAAGGSFVQIGVGALAKESNDPWQFYKYYKILNHGNWKIDSRADQIEFTHTFDDSAWSYEYKKTVRPDKGQASAISPDLTR